jgi:hypothetical protein
MKEYRTSDIHLAAALSSVDVELLKVAPDGRAGSRAVFVFSIPDKENINDTVMDYMNDRLEVSPRILFTRLRELKSMALNIAKD